MTCCQSQTSAERPQRGPSRPFPPSALTWAPHDKLTRSQPCKLIIDPSAPLGMTVGAKPIPGTASQISPLGSQLLIYSPIKSPLEVLPERAFYMTTGLFYLTAMNFSSGVAQIGHSAFPRTSTTLPQSGHTYMSTLGPFHASSPASAFSYHDA